MGSYLVTGVAGFIGSAVAKKLLEQGNEVVGIDNLTTGFEKNIPKGVTFFTSNCQEPTLYTNVLPRKKYDAILHIAGQSSGEISFDSPTYDLSTNTESTLRLLQFALECTCTRFIYASTMSVYGIQPDAPIKETASCFPESFYGVGKLASEHYLRIYGQYGIHSTALRLFNVYGPGQNMSNLRQGMVSIFMSMMMNDNHIAVKGSPNRYRDFVYIDDVVKAFMLCLQREESWGKILNIASGKKTSVGDLVSKIKSLSKKEVSVEYSGSTAGDIHGIYADISNAMDYLGYSPEIELEQGLAVMHEWCKKAM